MNIHARDRKRLFAVNFGKSYFHSQPVINPLGLALGLAIPICILAVAMLACVDSDAGYVFAISPLLVAAREKAARSLNKADEIRKKYKPEDAWASEDQTNFDAAIKDFKEANNEVVVLQAREDNLSELEQHRQNYLETRNNITQPPADGGNRQGVAEAFSRVVKTGRYNEKLGRVIVPGVADQVVDACLEIQREAFRKYMRFGEPGILDYASRQKAVKPEEIHALISNDQTLGGALVPEDVRSQIIMADAGAAVLAPLCRAENTMRDTLSWPKVTPHSTDNRRTSGFAGTWQRQVTRGTGDSVSTQNQPTFARERIPIHDWSPDAVEIETNLLEDADANVESIIAQAIGECLAFDKDDAILAGTGVNEPEGVLNCGCGTVASGGATSIAYGGILGLYVGLPQQYRRKATFVMHSWSMGAILQLNTGTGGVYLFPPNQWNNEILGRPVVFCDSDDIAKPTAEGGTTFTAATTPIIFGDWSRYILAQRRALRIQRLVETFAPNIGLLPSSRIGGQVVLTQAFRLMRIAAS